jgi:glyoxylase-like metal-dependent hydrolase (beta-lactamase superfamily II)
MSQSADQPGYVCKLLRAGPLRLDAGTMFGLIPRPLWSKFIETDAQDRMLLSHNCLLLERVGDSRRILIEAGSGNKFDAKLRGIYGLSDRTIVDAVKETGCKVSDIQDVVLSHLHFDHVGGLTRFALPDELPDWIGPTRTAGPELKIKLTFPNATIHVQKREWEDAQLNRSTMTRTYLPENLKPIAQHLRLLESPPLPFPSGYIPLRDELPATTLASRTQEILPGIFVFGVPGHTWGQQAIRFMDDRGKMVVFTPDVMPTSHHLGATYNLAYDVEPYINTVTRHWFLREAMENDWLLMLPHEVGNPWFRVRADGKGWFRLQGEEY